MLCTLIWDIQFNTCKSINLLLKSTSISFIKAFLKLFTIPLAFCVFLMIKFVGAKVLQHDSVHTT